MLTLQANNTRARLQYDVICERADKIIIRTQLNTVSLDSVSGGKFDIYPSFRYFFPIGKTLFLSELSLLFSILYSTIRQQILTV